MLDNPFKLNYDISKIDFEKRITSRSLFQNIFLEFFLFKFENL